MFPGNDVEASPLRADATPAKPVGRSHQVNLCCAVSVEPMVAEIARALGGLGFEATVVCGAAARASLLGDEDDQEPTLHVVCVQGQLRDRVLGPLRRALADRDRPDQHLLVAVLDLAMPLSMVGQIRRFAETLDHPFAGPTDASDGAERRQWREYLGGRALQQTPTRDYRPLQVIDRTRAPEALAAPTPRPKDSEAQAAATSATQARRIRRRRVFSATGPVTRVGATGKYQAIAAGHVTEVDPDAPSSEGTIELPSAAAPGATARYRVQDMIETGRHAAIDSIDAVTTAESVGDPSTLGDERETSVTSPRVGLASLLADGPMPAPGDGSVSIEAALFGDDFGTTPTDSKAPMAKLTLRQVPTGTYPMIVDKPVKRSAMGDRGITDPRAEPAAPPSTAAPPPAPTAPTSPSHAVKVGVTQPALRASTSSRPAGHRDNEDTDPDGLDIAAGDDANPRDAETVVGAPRPDPPPRRVHAWLFAVAAAAAVTAGTVAWLATDPRTPGLVTEASAVRAAAPATTAEAQPPATGREPAAKERQPPSPRAATGDRSKAPGSTRPPAAVAPTPMRGGRRTPPVPSGPHGARPRTPPAPPEASKRASPAAALAAAARDRRIQSVGKMYVVQPRNLSATSWVAAVGHCGAITVKGVSGWQLPWRRQLKQVAVTLGLRRGIWWSRSELTEDTDMVYGLDARSRQLREYMKSEVTGQVLCVRGKPR